MAVDVSVPVCHDCTWAQCRYRVSRVRSYLIAYREALKHGDDPAEYIRDSIKPSRHVGEDEGREITGALARSTRTRDREWHVDVKVSLERARASGLSLDANNPATVAAVASWMCSRAMEAQD